ncbi:hypothetical protein [Alkalicoccus daliensis]|uniref:Uncharacterized protein n=1 Tax=Alkalicoccus daliensis TaxID=745820 RepID=A0A1H0GYJ7_9BACI|nr:hypothetical protein [Alkalicoccus daliensis]SDO12116.1 hypothetical protein SAMN04488053_107102 [Alkalicoccus daliensis]
MKKVIGYLGYFILIIGTFLMIQSAAGTLREEAATTGEIETFLIPFIYIILGIFIGILPLIDQWKQSGSWKIRWQKLIFLGLPFLYLCAYPWITFNYETFTLPNFLGHLTLLSGESASFAGIMVGFILMTSIRKERGRSGFGR